MRLRRSLRRRSSACRTLGPRAASRRSGRLPVRHGAERLQKAPAASGDRPAAIDRCRAERGRIRRRGGSRGRPQRTSAAAHGAAGGPCGDGAPRVLLRGSRTDAWRSALNDPSSSHESPDRPPRPDQGGTMIDDRVLLERALRRFEPEPGLTDRVFRRRDRKRRNQRIAAGMVGIAVFLAAIALVSISLFDRTLTPGGGGNPSRPGRPRPRSRPKPQASSACRPLEPRPTRRNPDGSSSTSRAAGPARSPRSGCTPTGA